MPQPEVTILIPNYRTPKITRLCLRMLRKHTDTGRIHVIAIDNDSGEDDESLQYLRSLEWIELIERKAVPGESPGASHASALDMALERVTTPYVMSIHTDTFVLRSD
jgi:GT2 family glycosyltransferase